METILGIETKDKLEHETAYKIEADVIVTSVVLGFIGTRYHLNQSCRFDYEHPSPAQYKKWEAIQKLYQEIEARVAKTDKKDYSEEDKAFVEYKTFLEETQEFEHVMSAMSYVLDKTDRKLGKFLKDGQSAQWTPGALITGRAGGQMLEADERHKDMQTYQARRYAQLVTEAPDLFDDLTDDTFKGKRVYMGKGAYTGMIDDPVGNDTLIQRTKRVIDREKHLWHPGEASAAENKPWGLIAAKDKDDKYINLKKLEDGGLGGLPGGVNWKTDNIRYIHGMSSAIVKCVSAGPWCTPYEHASGYVTTKMASCFACTTYMYATGFPPSSSHLGRGESWVPPKPGLLSGEAIEDNMPAYYDENITASLIMRWHWDIYHYMNLGNGYLKRAMMAVLEDQESLKAAHIDKKVIHYVNPMHANAVLALGERLSQFKKEYIGRMGGNLFLDALTVHESDWRRIMQTLQPLCDYYKGRLSIGDILID